MPYALNRVQLLGNVGRDPDTRNLSSGGQVMSFSLATTDKWKDKASGDWKESTQWHNIVVWNDNLVRGLKGHVKKGSRLMVEGRLETRKWTGQDGQDRYSVEVVVRPYSGQIWLLDARGAGGGQNREARRESDQAEAGWGSGGGTEFDDKGAGFSDDIPF